MEYYAQCVYEDGSLGIGSNSYIVSGLKTKKGSLKRISRWAESNRINHYIVYRYLDHDKYSEEKWEEVYRHGVGRCAFIPR